MDNVKDDIILNNLGLVNKVIMDKIIYNIADYDDLFQVGCVGLIVAVNTFDESKNVKFSTYAYKVIHMEIFNYLKHNQKKKENISLDTTFLNKDNNDDLNLMSTVVDDRNGPEEIFIMKEEREIINKLLKKARMSDRNKFIILLYYGFYNNRVYTRKELASIFNISSTYVGKVIDNFLKEMRRLIAIEYLKDIFNNKTKIKNYKRN